MDVKRSKIPKDGIRVAGKPEDVIFIGWFDETMEKAHTFFADKNDIPLYQSRQANASISSKKKILFIEHHPDAERENELYKSIGLKNPEVWPSMDEAIFKSFGGERILGLMKQLGMQEEEAIEHKMISNSIKTAQKKIAKKIISDNYAFSQEEWMRKNLKI